MDILLVASSKNKDQTHVKATSIHGMLWLQTHFESAQWEAISSENVILQTENAKMLAKDVQEAGLRLNSIPKVSCFSKI